MFDWYYPSGYNQLVKLSSLIDQIIEEDSIIMNRRVEGIYTNVDDAMNAVNRLHEEGYSRDDIKVVANATVRETMPFTMDAEVTSDTDTAGMAGDDNRSLWDKIKDAFTVDEYDAMQYGEEDTIRQYHDDIENGHILVLVNDDGRPMVSDSDPLTDRTAVTEDSLDHPGGISEAGAFTTPDLTVAPPSDTMDDTTLMGDNTPREADPLYTEDRLVDPLVTDDAVRANDPLLEGRETPEDETLELKEERLDVDTHEVQTGDVHVHKHVEEETETVNVPVSHDEVTIERRPVRDPHTTDEKITDFGDTEEIVIPITEEQVDVTKHTDVVEEVVIRKDRVTEDKEVSDTVRKEELDVDGDVDVRLEDEDDLNRRP